MSDSGKILERFFCDSSSRASVPYLIGLCEGFAREDGQWAAQRLWEVYREAQEAYIEKEKAPEANPGGPFGPAGGEPG